MSFTITVTTTSPAVGEQHPSISKGKDPDWPEEEAGNLAEMAKLTQGAQEGWGREEKIGQSEDKD